MRYASAGALRDALEARLGERARQGQSIARLRKQVAFERLLRRLQQTAPDLWLLKGGFALELRLADRARATGDIDLDWSLGEEAATGALIDAARLDLGDYFEFRLQRVEMPEDIGGRGQRWRATARLAGRTFEQVLVDVGYATKPLLDPEMLMLPSQLAFAGVEPVSVPAAALEQHLAEKLHAYTRRYAGDRPSSRVKDLVDIVLIAGIAHVQAQRLDDGINRLFDARGTHARPSTLPRHRAHGQVPTPPWRRMSGWCKSSMPHTPRRRCSSTRCSQAKPRDAGIPNARSGEADSDALARLVTVRPTPGAEPRAAGAIRKR